MGFRNFWTRSTTAEIPTSEVNATASDSEVIHDGDLTYTIERANNDSKPSYQEAAGAPVESKSPLGYHVGWLTVIFLNVNQMIGTGIFSTRKFHSCDAFEGDFDAFNHSWNYSQ